MKKYLAIILAVLMLCMALAACGTPATTGTDVPDESKTPEGTDTSTVAVGAVIIARDDVPEDEIYAFVSAIFENTDTIAAARFSASGQALSSTNTAINRVANEYSRAARWAMSIYGWAR